MTRACLETKCSEDVLMFGNVSAGVAREMIDLMRQNEEEIERLRAENAAQKAEIARLLKRERIRIDWDIDG